MKTEIHTRLNKDLWRKVNDELVSNPEKYKTISDVVRTAIEAFFAKAVPEIADTLIGIIDFEKVAQTALEIQTVEASETADSNDDEVEADNILFDGEW